MKKTILLTGVTGFLGSHVLRFLLKSNNFNVVAIKRRRSNIYRIADLTHLVYLYDFDGDRSAIEKIFTENKVDLILHMATCYGRDPETASDVINTNLVLPILIIENAIKNNVDCFINIDSYFNKAGLSYNALANYSLSKKSLLNWFKNFSRQIKIINLYLEHVYGEFDSNSKFVESIIRRIAIDNEDRIALTHGHQRRDFVYVADVVKAIDTIITSYELGNRNYEDFEIGTGVAIEIRHFVEYVKTYSSSRTLLDFGAIMYRNDEIMESKANISKISNKGFKPLFSMEDGIKKIIDLYLMQRHINSNN